jgi:hypothetical protein
MASRIEVHVRLVPWDDPGFLQAFEQAREQVAEEGLALTSPAAAARTEQIIRSAGFPTACVQTDQTVVEALAHETHWMVLRDGPLS